MRAFGKNAPSWHVCDGGARPERRRPALASAEPPTPAPRARARADCAPMAYWRLGVLTVSATTTTSFVAEVARLSPATATESPSPRGGRAVPARPAHASDRAAMHWAAASRSQSDHRRELSRCVADPWRLLLGRAPGRLGRRRARAAGLAEAGMGERVRAVLVRLHGRELGLFPRHPSRAPRCCTPRRLATARNARSAGRRASACYSRAGADGGWRERSRARCSRPMPRRRARVRAAALADHRR